MNAPKHWLSLAAVALALAASIVLLSPLWAADSPITLGDGSILLGNPGGDLGQWTVVSRTIIAHPQQGNAMAEIDVTGPNATAATCAGRGQCVVEVRWSTGQSIRLASTAAGSRGARFEAQGVAFDDPAWQKSATQWRFNLPAGATPTVTVRDGGGAAQTICQGSGCRVTVHYR